jgi:nitrous oxidase accessory protein NosD
MRTFRRASVVTVSAMVGALGVAGSPASAAAHQTLTVGPGQSIQAAVNRAHSGDTIRVRAGTYHQNVTITKSGITLQGSGASSSGTVLLPPTNKHPFCGICVFGDVNFRTGQVKSYVYNVRIRDFMINNFSAFGVVTFGANGTVMEHNSANGNGEYGLTSFNSIGSIFAWNTATGSGEAGIYVGDSPHANATVSYNNVSGNALGVFVRHAHYVHVTANKAHGNCQGILVLDDGERGGAGDATIRYNDVERNNKVCPPGDEAPPLSGGGILLLGATHTVVAQNIVKDNRGHDLNSGGIVLLSAAPFGGANVHDANIRNNTAYRNAPADIRWDGLGLRNIFVDNRCGHSDPARICS